ncbi:MAG TPA: hypothetical protein VN867_02805 [Candidatus Binataceae bacterium]|nr:hypothetical protein [Candidatus Binataceae bacterium]
MSVTAAGSAADAAAEAPNAAHPEIEIIHTPSNDAATKWMDNDPVLSYFSRNIIYARPLYLIEAEIAPMGESDRVRETGA